MWVRFERDFEAASRFLSENTDVQWTAANLRAYYYVVRVEREGGLVGYLVYAQTNDSPDTFELHVVVAGGWRRRFFSRQVQGFIYLAGFMLGAEKLRVESDRQDVLEIVERLGWTAITPTRYEIALPKGAMRWVS